MSSRHTCLVVVLALGGCLDEAAPDKPDLDGFELGDPGKADSMMSTQDRQRLIEALDRAIADGEVTVAELEREIASLEQQHAAKQAEADRLLASIAAREADLTASFERTMLLCAFIASPSCVLANVLANDSTLREYRRLLAAAQAERDRIAAEIADYQANRDTIRTRITDIRAGKQEVLDLLATNTLPPAPLELANDPEAATAYGRSLLLGDLHGAIKEEIGTLVDLRDAAVATANSLDASLATMRGLEQSVDTLVRKQREQFMKLVASFLSGDPAAAAEKWLDTQLANQTRQLLGQLAWPLNEFARYLASSRGEGDVDALARRLLEKMLSTTPPKIYAATTPVNILDETKASSGIYVSDSRSLSAFEIWVDIEHGYIGDLEVWVEHAGSNVLFGGVRYFPLQDRAGGSNDNLQTTFEVSSDTPFNLTGRWTLHVEDHVRGDQGTLKRWELIVR